jgi:hypothetical protein
MNKKQFANFLAKYASELVPETTPEVVVEAPQVVAEPQVEQSEPAVPQELPTEELTKYGSSKTIDSIVDILDRSLAPHELELDDEQMADNFGRTMAHLVMTDIINEEGE